MRVMTYEQKHQMMTQTPVEKLIPKLAVPTIISMLITSVYNMADTFFVSQISTSATGAVGVNFSLMALIQAIGFTLGMGSGNYMSRMLGAKEQERAQRACSTAVISAFVLGALLAAAGLANLDALVHILGATDTIAPYAKAYGQYILLAAPVMTCVFVLNNHLRWQGNANLSMIGIASGGILNCILDPIFIMKMNMGVAGAARATVISQMVSFLILLVLTLTTKGNIKPNPKYFTFRLWVFKEIITAGLPSLFRQGLASFATMSLNLMAAGFGDAAVAAMSIVQRFMMFMSSAIIGFGQGFQPVCGFNYGAGRYERVLAAYRFCMKVSFIVLFCFGAVVFAGAEPIMKIFRGEDADVVRIGVYALRLQCVALPLQALAMMSNMLLQSIGYSMRATFTALLRQGIYFIPAVYLLPRYFGELGLELSQPIADVLTTATTLWIVYYVVQELKSKCEII